MAINKFLNQFLDSALPFTHFKCNDNASNTVVTDDGSGANNGVSTINTSNLSVSGKINDAFNFNGTDEFAYVTAMTTDVKADTTGSISVWFKIDALGATRGIFSMTDNTGADKNYFYLRVNADGTIQCVERSGLADPRMGFNTGSAISAGVWNHVVITQDGTSYKIYVNGLDVTSSTTDFYPQTNGWFGSGGSTFNIGAIGAIFISNYAQSSFFNGDIDDFRYYSGNVLSSVQVAFIYNSGNGTENNIQGSSKILSVSKANISKILNITK